MENQENISNYFIKIPILTNQIKTNGDKIEDLIIIEKILKTLPPRFDYIVVALEELKDLSGMTIDEL